MYEPKHYSTSLVLGTLPKYDAYFVQTLEESE